MSLLIDNPIPVIQVGNVGTVFVFTMCDQDGNVIDLSSATVLEALFFKPVSRTTITRTGILTTDGTDGKFQYTSIAGDLDEAHNQWRRQARIVIPAGEFRSFQRRFTVKGNIA